MFWDEILLYGILFGVPLLVSVFFVVSLIRFFITDKADTARRRKRLIILIIASLLFVAMVAGAVALVIMLSNAMAHM